MLEFRAGASRLPGTKGQSLLCAIFGPASEEIFRGPFAPSLDELVERCRLNFSRCRHGVVVYRAWLSEK